MISAATSFKNAIVKNARMFRAKLLDNGTEISGDIRKVVIYRGSCGDDFSPGVTYSPYIEATIDNCTDELEGHELQLQIGVRTNTSYQSPTFSYITLGYFTVGKPSVNLYQTTFTAQGRIASKLFKPFIPPTPLTIKLVANKISSITGVNISFGSGLNSSAMILGPMKGLTCREALAIAAAACGGYATETNTGTIIIRKYDMTPTIEYTADFLQQSPAFTNKDANITGVKVLVKEATEDEEEISYSSGTVNLIMDNIYMTEGAFAHFATNLIGLTWRPGRIPIALGDPRLDPWDVLNVSDEAGTQYIVPCMSIIHTFDGGFSTIINAPGLPDEMRAPSNLAKATKTAQAAEALAADAKSAAQEAKRQADSAATAAQAAQSSADAAASSAASAQSSANQAITDAGNAATAANNAQTSANNAQTSANNAQQSASNAHLQLSVLEQVLNTVNWITQHGTYRLTTDSAVVSGKAYFILSGGNYLPVTNPRDEDISTYYELIIDEAVTNYVASHLSLTDDGLYVILNNSSYRLLVASDGVSVLDEYGNTVTKYGSNIRFASDRPQYIGGENAYIVFYDKDEDGVPESISIGGDNVFIGEDRNIHSVVESLDSLSVGGRNLLRGTGAANQYDKWAFLRAAVAGDGIIRLTPNTSGAYARSYADYLLYGVYKDQEYVLSFDAKIVDPEYYDTVEPNLITGTTGTNGKYAELNGSEYHILSSYYYFTEEGQALLAGNTDDYITVSFDYQLVGAVSAEGNKAGMYAQINNNQGNAKLHSVEPNESGHFSETFKLISGQADYGSRFRFRVRLRYTVEGAHMRITHPKITIGTEDTPWVPSAGEPSYDSVVMPDKIVAYMGVITPDRNATATNFGSEYERYINKTIPLVQNFQWNRYSLSYIVPDDFTLGPEEVLVDDNYLQIQLGLSANKYAIDIRNVKLEKGNRASDWTPALEDIQDQIDSAAQTAQENANAAQETATAAHNEIMITNAVIERLREEIRLEVSKLANNNNYYAASEIEDWTTTEIPTLQNYPAFTDFFIWDKCASDIYCSNALICGTNNYAAHAGEICLNSRYKTYYQWRNNNGYSWEQMTAAEIEALSQKMASISVDEDQVYIKVGRNHQIGTLKVTATGVESSTLYCC